MSSCALRYSNAASSDIEADPPPFGLVKRGETLSAGRRWWVRYSEESDERDELAAQQLEVLRVAGADDHDPSDVVASERSDQAHGYPTRAGAVRRGRAQCDVACALGVTDERDAVRERPDLHLQCLGEGLQVRVQHRLQVGVSGARRRKGSDGDELGAVGGVGERQRVTVVADVSVDVPGLRYAQREAVLLATLTLEGSDRAVVEMRLC